MAIHDVLSISTDSVSVMVPVVTTLRVAVATKHVPACSAQGSYLHPAAPLLTIKAPIASSSIGVKPEGA